MGLKIYRGYCPVFLFLALAALILLGPVPAQAQWPNTGAIAITLTDPEGAALPGVVVTAAGLGRHWTSVTNAAGRARFRCLPVGEYQLSATMPGFKTWTGSATVSLGQTTSLTATLQLAEALPDLTVHSQPLEPRPLAVQSSEYGRIRVELSGLSGPLAGASVQLSGPRVLRFKSTGADGLAEFTQVPPGSYFITASAANYWSRNWNEIQVLPSHTATLTAQLNSLGIALGQATPGHGTARVRLTQKPLAATNNQGRLEFNVFDSAGLPASGAVCIAVGGGGIHLDFTDSDGLSRFPGLPYGWYFLHVHQDGAEDWFSEYVLNEAWPSPVAVQLTASSQIPDPAEEEPGGLVFSLLNSAGMPVAYDVVYLVNHDEQQLIFGVTDGAGQADFTALVPGIWYLFAQNMNPKTVEVEAGRTIEVIGVMGD